MVTDESLATIQSLYQQLQRVHAGTDAHVALVARIRAEVALRKVFVGDEMVTVAAPANHRRVAWASSPRPSAQLRMAKAR